MSVRERIAQALEDGGVTRDSADWLLEPDRGFWVVEFGLAISRKGRRSSPDTSNSFSYEGTRLEEGALARYLVISYAPSAEINDVRIRRCGPGGCHPYKRFLRCL
jgi:hypothetical protein